MLDLREIPIKLEVLGWTGKKDGDDAGYRDVAVSPAAEADPDPLVRIGTEIPSYPVYAHGAKSGICPYYGTGIGGDADMLVRAPVLMALKHMDRILQRYGRRPYPVDCFRPAQVQAALWVDVFRRLAGDRDPSAMSVTELLEIGMKADDTGSYAPVKLGPYLDALKALGVKVDPQSSQAQTYITFLVNLGIIQIPFDESAPTAHGSGGAVDMFMIDIETGNPTNLGVPFDCADAPAAAMDWFEDPANLEPYQQWVAGRPDVQEHLAFFGISSPTRENFNAIRDERRILHHVAALVGATIYCGECWHFNFPNRGGKQAIRYPNAGNACHSLLRNVRDESGAIVAVWGNSSAHRLWRELNNT